MTGQSKPPSRQVANRRLDDGFCPTCEVTLDLHDTTDGEDDFDCKIAGRKADLLAEFGWLVR